MASSGTYSFSLPLDELIDQAIPLAGGEPTGGQDIRFARRALDLLFIDVQNRGIRLHSLIQTDVSISTTSTILDATLQDVLDATVFVSGTSYDVERMGFGDYIDISRKGQSGRPTRFFVDRKVDAPVLYVWPVPTSAVTFSFWGVKQTQDGGKLTNTPDFHRRYWPTLVWGLAYHIAASRGMKVPPDRLLFLKGEFEQALDFAAGEDRERITLKVKPNYRRR